MTALITLALPFIVGVAAGALLHKAHTLTHNEYYTLGHDEGFEAGFRKALGRKVKG